MHSKRMRLVSLRDEGELTWVLIATSCFGYVSNFYKRGRKSRPWPDTSLLCHRQTGALIDTNTWTFSGPLEKPHTPLSLTYWSVSLKEGVLLPECGD